VGVVANNFYTQQTMDTSNCNDDFCIASFTLPNSSDFDTNGKDSGRTKANPMFKHRCMQLMYDDGYTAKMTARQVCDYVNAELGTNYSVSLVYKYRDEINQRGWWPWTTPKTEDDKYPWENNDAT